MATKEIKELHALIDGTSYPAGVEAARRDSKGKIINETYLAGVAKIVQNANQTTINPTSDYTTIYQNYNYLKIIGAESNDKGTIPSLSYVENLINAKITQGAEYLGTTSDYNKGSPTWSKKQPNTAGDWGRYTGNASGSLHNGDILIYNGAGYDVVHAEADNNTYPGVKVNSNIVLTANGVGYLNLVNGNKISFAKNSDGTVTANHATYTAQNVNSDFVKTLTSDGYGHITGATGGTAGVISSDNTIIMTTDAGGNVSLSVNVEKLPGQVTATKPIVATQDNTTKVYDISLLTGAGLSTAGETLSVSLPGVKTTGSGNVVKDVSISGAQITQKKTLVINQINGRSPNSDGNFVLSAGNNITFDNDANGNYRINSAGGAVVNNDTAATGRKYIAEITSKTNNNITTSYYKSNAYFESFKSTSDYNAASIDATTGVVSLTVKA